MEVGVPAPRDRLLFPRALASITGFKVQTAPIGMV